MRHIWGDITYYRPPVPDFFWGGDVSPCPRGIYAPVQKYLSSQQIATYFYTHLEIPVLFCTYFFETWSSIFDRHFTLTRLMDRSCVMWKKHAGLSAAVGDDKPAVDQIRTPISSSRVENWIAAFHGIKCWLLNYITLLSCWYVINQTHWVVSLSSFRRLLVILSQTQTIQLSTFHSSEGLCVDVYSCVICV